jgi:hypothetical protein
MGAERQIRWGVLTLLLSACGGEARPPATGLCGPDANPSCDSYGPCVQEYVSHDGSLPVPVVPTAYYCP